MSPITAAHRPARERPSVDARLDELLRGLVAVGAAVVLLLPAARGTHAVIGWLPLWLLVMPATAWWALHRFRMPTLRVERASPPRLRSPVRTPVQARRRTRGSARSPLSQAA